MSPWSDTDWNAVRYTAETPNHVESYFLKATSADAERAFWLKATIFASADEPAGAKAEAWAVAFDHRGPQQCHVAVKHTVPHKKASFSDQGLGVDWQEPASGDRMHLEPGIARGAVTTRGDRIKWDLRFAGDDRPVVPFPFERMYTGPFPSSKLVTPYPDVRFEGELGVGDDSWSIDGWRGMQGHNWGRGHAEQYAWAHCNQWQEDSPTVLEAVSARVRVGPLLTPTLTVVSLRHEGQDYYFNQPLELLRAKGDIGLRRYRFQAASKVARIEGELEAEVDDFVGLYYANPQGEMTYCLNSKLASGRLRFEAEGKPPLDLTTKAAAFEAATKRSDHGVKMYV